MGKAKQNLLLQEGRKCDPNDLLYCLIFTISSGVIGGKRPPGLEISPGLLHRHVAKHSVLHSK